MIRQVCSHLVSGPAGASALLGDAHAEAPHAALGVDAAQVEGADLTLIAQRPRHVSLGESSQRSTYSSHTGHVDTPTLVRECLLIRYVR